MWVEFKQTLLWRLRGQLIGWSIGLGIYSLMLAALYPSVSQIEDLAQFLASYPEEMMAFFGMLTELGTPAGYLDTYFFNYMTLIVGIFVIGAGAGLLVGDEERGTLDLILAHPISRTALFGGRLLALAAATVILLLVNWAIWAGMAAPVGLNLTAVEVLRPFVPLLAQLMLFGIVALLLSMVLPARRMAGMLTGALLVGNYLLTGLANIEEDLQPLLELTPLHYYQGGLAVEGVNWSWVGGLLFAALVLAAGAWALFRRREIRVGGEHSWRLSDLGRFLRRR